MRCGAVLSTILIVGLTLGCDDETTFEIKVTPTDFRTVRVRSKSPSKSRPPSLTHT